MEADEKFFVNFSDCNELLAIVRLNELVEKEGRLGGKEGGEGESLRKIGARTVIDLNRGVGRAFGLFIYFAVETELIHSILSKEFQILSLSVDFRFFLSF